MLLEGDKDEEERINRAFRDDLNRDKNNNHQKNMKLFNSYILGGISILYEEISQDALDREDLLSNIKEFVEDFNNDLILNKYEIEDIPYEADII